MLDNFFSLSVVQFANYLAPLITLPYLFRVLGPSKYGLIEFARAISVYFLMLTDYGFSLSATRAISVHRDDPRKVSEIFSSVLLLKFLLVVLSFITLSLIVFSASRLRAEWPVYFLSFGSVIGMWLFPVWLFQGLERMRHIATLNVTAKLLVIVAIFVFIRDEADYVYVPLLQSAGTIVIGAAGLAVALLSFPVRFQFPALHVLKHEFVDGWHLFISKMATTLYTTTNIVILGWFTNDSFVAYYAAGDKIVRAVQGLQIPLSQAIFPHIGKLATQSKEAALAYTARVTKIVGVAMLLLSIGLLLGAPHIARVVLGQQSQAGVPVIRILSFLPFLIGLSSIFGIQVMVNFGLQKVMTKILTAAGVLNIVAALFLVTPFQHIGVSLAALATETFVTVALFIALRRNNLDMFRVRIAAASDKGVDSREAAT